MTTTAIDKDYALCNRLARREIDIEQETARQLRRIERTLHRWAELECGDGDEYKSWVITRDEATDKPYMEYHFHDGRVRRYATPDREAGALKRLAAICKRHGIHYYHQTDPRGCALYLSREPMTDENYSSIGTPVCS